MFYNNTWYREKVYFVKDCKSKWFPFQLLLVWLSSQDLKCLVKILTLNIKVSSKTKEKGKQAKAMQVSLFKDRVWCLKYHNELVAL